MITPHRLIGAFVLLILSCLPHVQSFSNHRISRATINSLPAPLPTSLRNKMITCAMNSDDDGWGDGDSPSESVESASVTERNAKNKELEMLQNDLSAKRADTLKSASASSNSSEERDLFIPIFTLVSVIGFTGLYGYEMLRLYSRGELYLPWEQ